MGAFQEATSARGELTKFASVNGGGWRRQILLYFLHFTISLGVFATGILLRASAETVVGTAVANALFGGPAYIGQVTIGFLAGVLAYRQWPTRLAAWVWVPAGWWLGGDIKAYADIGGIHYVLHFLFGTGCGGCFEQFLVVCPFYASLAYALGAWTTMCWQCWHQSSR